MHPNIRSLLALLLALSVVDIVCWGTLLPAPQDRPVAPPEASSARKISSIHRKVEFTETNSEGEVAVGDGVILGFESFRSSDGFDLTLYYDRTSMPGEADTDFAQQMSVATKVVSRQVRLDSKGKKVGDRAEISMLSDEPNRTTYAILWTDGRRFHEVRSLSLRVALEFEKVYKN
jgi:hypothetical protein